MGQINLKTTDTPQTPGTGRVGIFIATSGQPKAINDEGTETPLAGIADAPSDGQEYVRKDAAWEIKTESLAATQYLDSNECLFDNAYTAGTKSAPRTGNITLNLTGAVRGGSTKMYHQDASAFTIENEVDLVYMFPVADISDTDINLFLFVYEIDDADSNAPYVEIYLGLVDNVVAGV